MFFTCGSVLLIFHLSHNCHVMMMSNPRFLLATVFFLQTNNTQKKFWAHEGIRTYNLPNTAQCSEGRGFKSHYGLRIFSECCWFVKRRQRLIFISSNHSPKLLLLILVSLFIQQVTYEVGKQYFAQQYCSVTPHMVVHFGSGTEVSWLNKPVLLLEINNN